MRLFIRSAIALVILAILAFTAFWLYLSSLPTVAPQQVSVNDATVSGCQCLHKGTEQQRAYQVSANVRSSAGQKNLYDSLLTFRFQLQPLEGNRLAGKATDIQIAEQSGAIQRIDDVAFMLRSSEGLPMAFVAFNDLGLMQQHPMKVLAQVIKNLSVGAEDEVYRYAYDGLQRLYRYRKQDDRWQRTVSAPGAQQASDSLQPKWQVELDDQCLPRMMSADEIQALTLSGEQGFIRFVVNAERTDNYLSADQFQLTAGSNSHHQWQVQNLQPQQGGDIVDEQSMWQAFADFNETHNVAELKQAAYWLMENISVYDLALDMQQQADQTNRDIIFALGLIKTPQTEAYLLDLLSGLPGGSAANDLNRVRVMVAVAGYEQVSQYAYDSLALLADSAAEPDNIRDNALINMGSVARQMAAQGEDVSVTMNNLSATLLSELQADNASAAIFSAGNAGLNQLSDDVSDAISSKLTTGSEKERYAAAVVLSRDSGRYSQLYSQAQNEPSALVRNAIVQGLSRAGINSDQQQALMALTQ